MEAKMRASSSRLREAGGSVLRGFRKGNSSGKGRGGGGEYTAFLPEFAEEKGRVETRGCTDRFGYITGVHGKPQIAFQKRSVRGRLAF